MDLAQLPPKKRKNSNWIWVGRNWAAKVSPSYDLWGYQSFFTVGEDEVRAWRARRGASAFEAAGLFTPIYRKASSGRRSSTRKNWALGGYPGTQCRQATLEGKEYILIDGDICMCAFLYKIFRIVNYGRIAQEKKYTSVVL
jgi:ribosome-binding ATPase YchF (GTP1/OBG family)